MQMTEIELLRQICPTTWQIGLRKTEVFANLFSINSTLSPPADLLVIQIQKICQDRTLRPLVKNSISKITSLLTCLYQMVGEPFVYSQCLLGSKFQILYSVRKWKNLLTTKKYKRIENTHYGNRGPQWRSNYFISRLWHKFLEIQGKFRSLLQIHLRSLMNQKKLTGYGATSVMTHICCCQFGACCYYSAIPKGFVFGPTLFLL